MGDTCSPAGSDNEDELYQGTSSQRRKGQTSNKYAVDQPSPLSQAQPGSQDLDSLVMSASKVSIRPANAYESSSFTADHDSMQPPRAPYMISAPGTRKNLSAQIPIITPSMASQTPAAQELSSPVSMPIMSPVTSTAGASTIIDQDAEKFRQYMSKMSSPSRKNMSAPIQIGTEFLDPARDHASALGQAVALENIQNQLDMQNQLLGQLQGMILMAVDPRARSQSLAHPNAFPMSRDS